MSSSFTDQPPPDRPHEEGYTPTPPPPERGHWPADEGDADMHRLGSLAQKARGKRLRSARTILFFLVGLTVVLNGIFLFLIPMMVQNELEKEIRDAGGYNRVDPAEVEQIRNERLLINYAITGGFFVLGVLFLIFGALVYRYPVAMTVSGLVLYLLATVIMLAVNPVALAGCGVVLRIVFIVALAKSVQTAIAYERERRADEDYALNG